MTKSATKKSSAKTLPILVLNGPNLNMLGMREPHIYGKFTMRDLENLCHKSAEKLGLTVDCRQSNAEGDLITWVQQSRTTHSGIIINAGAYTHTSVAIMDALTLSDLPVIEVHLSNIYKREEYRHLSFVSKVAKGVICGLGVDGYSYAIDAIAKLINAPKK